MARSGKHLWSAAVVAVILLLASWPGTARADDDGPPVRILFLTDCTVYSDWQSIGMVYSYLYSRHKGPITRVMCCTEEDRKNYPKEMLELVETHIAPAMTVHPKTGDVYAAYNKPLAVIDYMEKVTPPEEWMLVLDSDMQVRSPWRVKDYNLSEGWASGSRYDYMIGVNNPLADKHIPEIARRNDTFAGPFGRRSDMVGGFFFIHRNDLKRLSKGWLSYTEDVREDPEAYKWTGDQYATQPGQKPWISEMYGYSYGAAKANVWHHWDEHSMLYPGYTPGGIPRVLHYGLEWDVQGYQYDKHWYTGFNPMKCPPWDLTPKHPQVGLFPHPPRPSDLKTMVYMDRYRDLIAVEGVATLNAGLCWWYRQRCPASEQLTKECDKAEAIYFETREALAVAESVFDCIDYRPECKKWVDAGECDKNTEYMSYHCKASCKKCVAKEYATYDKIFDMLSHPKGVRLVPQPIPNPVKRRQKQPTFKKGPDGPVTNPATNPTNPATNPPATNPSPVPASPVPSPVPSPPPPPPPSPPPPSPPPPVVVAKPTRVPVHDDISDGQPPKLRELLRRCYRLGTLSIEEVKQCVAAAKEGKEWNKPHVEPAPQKAAGDTDAVKKIATDTPVTKDTVDPKPTVTAANTPTAKNLESAFSWQQVSVWLLFAAVLIYIVPRAIRRTRRTRSGLRAE